MTVEDKVIYKRTDPDKWLMTVAKSVDGERLGVTNWVMFDGPVSKSMIFDILIDHIADDQGFAGGSLKGMSNAEIMEKLGIHWIECYEVDDENQSSHDEYMFAILTGNRG